jgi:hypothetical protein
MSARVSLDVRHTVREGHNRSRWHCNPPDKVRTCAWQTACEQGCHSEAAHTMIWFLKRDSDLLICEVRRDGTQYAIELAPSQGPPQIRRYDSARDLIRHHVHATQVLKAQGWRPAGDIDALA